MRKEERRVVEDRRGNRFWHRWKNTLAYVGLSLALFFAVYRGEDARHDFERASVKSGTAVATVGCNRDFRTNQRLRLILERGSASADRQLATGDLSPEKHRELKLIYSAQLEALPLPDCRKIKIAASPDLALEIPIQLYPGSEWQNKGLPGEKFSLPEENPPTTP